MNRHTHFTQDVLLGLSVIGSIESSNNDDEEQNDDVARHANSYRLS